MTPAPHAHSRTRFRLERLWPWSAPWAERAALWLLVAAAALLFLNAAATVEVGFTLQPSYGLALAAVALGAPAVVRGWRRMPPPIRLAAAVLLAVYLLALGLGVDAGLASQAGRSRFRDLVYVADLAFGLALIGLVAGLAQRPGAVRRLVWGLLASAAAAAAYGLYQWPAQHFGWPLADLNTGLNSDGFSRGHRFQGSGLLGWERIRGTFKEPLFLAGFIVVAAPLAIGELAGSRGRTRALLALGIAVGLAALTLTVSSLSWGLLGLGGLVVAALAAVAWGHVHRAALAGAALAGALLIAPLVFADPSALAGVTGRSQAELQSTSANRVGAWDGALDVWEARPVLGHGPGQSAVRLAYRPEGAAIRPGLQAPVVLGSAQGLWAASLIDVGLVGLAAWAALIGALFALGVQAFLRAPSWRAVGIVGAAALAVLLGQLAGDRLDARIWLALGLLGAVACHGAQAEAGAGGDEAAESPRERPQAGLRDHLLGWLR